MGARFVRLGIAGFKSFADAASLEILPGLTGVVGPNGCGKSNVAEALRWAMGEANARYLRGGEMDDVIFAGTANRPSRNLAEVSLTIEDDEAGLPPPFAGQQELQVVRRIERGAGSAYRVNGKEARARDVQTLFADLASGSRSSAMVSQGRVGALVNARPEERRAVLEEAAGITGLHARRAEAEMRLRAAETNLERAEERRAILERQLDGLRGQAKQAARYRTVMTSVLEAEAALLGLQRARTQAARDEAQAALAAATAAVQQAIVAARGATADAERVQAALPQLRDDEAEARTRLERARLLQESETAEAARAQATLAAAQQRQSQLARDLTHAQTVLQDADAADARLVAEAARLEAESIAFPAALEAAQAETLAAGETLRAADAEATEAAAAVADATARINALQQILSQAEARASRAQAAWTRLTTERDRAATQIVDPARLTAGVEGLAAAERVVIGARAAQDRGEAERSRAAPAAASARESHSRLDAARHKLLAETTALSEVLAVKDGERWPPMVDRLAVPAGLEMALGAALGEELAAADDPAAARHWRPMPLRAGTRDAGPPLPGQSMVEAVKAPALLDRALSAIGLVQSDEEGDRAQPALQPGQSLVSAAGAVWRWDGYTVRAGTPTAAAVRLRQRNRLMALQSQLAQAEKDALAARARREAADADERNALAADQQARIARRDAEAAADRARSLVHGLRHQAEAALARLAVLDEQIAHLAPEADAAGLALEAARQEIERLPSATSLRAAADIARATVAGARNRDNAAARNLEAVQRAAQGRQSRIISIGRERDDRRMRAADLTGRVADLSARSIEAAADLERLVVAPGDSARKANEAKAAVEDAQSAHAAAAAVREAAERYAAVAASTARTAEHAAFAGREAVVRAEGAVETASQAWEASEARIGEREGALPPLPVQTDLSPAAEERARGRLQRLSRERDDMGPVNLRAEIESDAVGTDIATIIRERDELGTAIAKLRGSIGHLNREGRERLSAIFQQVDRHFQALFGRMFGGGRAHLALVGSDDPLQAGLEIFAQPPGKKLAALSLLSGGEQALTALSLVFAVFRCNPAPLCVLDEVDAPLDDANVDRFCSLLGDIVQETGTRFLVVTHHQVTMARMDRLYGVTMQERGVSRLLSVDLSRAVGMIEAVAAE